MRRPNTFIVGAPKCGTTALASYLRAHPAVFFSEPKEPNYFNRDDPEAFRRIPHGGRLLANDADYLALFAGARAEHAVVAEGSVWYLSSPVAIPALLALNPDARVIAMLRSPLATAPSLHAQELYSFNEDEPSFARAWALQEERKSGRSLPPRCLAPGHLQYREICMLGAQVERLFSLVSPARRMTVVFDDFAADTAGEWRRVLDFLDLPPDGRTEFPRVNERSEHRIPWLSFLLLGRAPFPLVRLAAVLKRRLGLRSLGIRPAVLRLNVRPTRRQTLPPALRAELARDFAGDVRRLGSLLGRDLGHWLTG